MDAPHHDPYPWLAPFYDVSASLMLLPFGGQSRVRARSIDVIDGKRGCRVLELGCGTGAMTARLLTRGYDVTAIDLSDAMLKRARRRCPNAHILKASITNFVDDAPFDFALLSFVIHELPDDVLRQTFDTARRALRDGGALVVVDFAKPRSRVLARGLNTYLTLTEPRQARVLVARGIERTLAMHGFDVEASLALAGGTARSVRARVAR